MCECLCGRNRVANYLYIFLKEAYVCKCKVKKFANESFLYNTYKY